MFEKFEGFESSGPSVEVKGRLRGFKTTATRQIVRIKCIQLSHSQFNSNSPNNLERIQYE